MIVKLLRYNSKDDYTDGMIFVDDQFICYTLEDEARTEKVWGETRIPNGTYKIGLRKEGKFDTNYTYKFNNKESKNYINDTWHKGMLCIYNFDNWKIVTPGMSFQYILIHIGNTDEDTAGCVLVGSTAYMDKNKIDDSTGAYKKLYPIIANALEKGEEVKIVVDIL